MENAGYSDYRSRSPSVGDYTVLTENGLNSFHIRALMNNLIDNTNKRTSITSINMTFVCPCIASIIVNDDQKDATILVYLLIPNQLYMFRAMSWPIVRST